jgi:serine/threonine protein kinase
LIGAGASAIVLAVNDELAVKLFPSGPKHKRDYEREVEIFQKLKAKNSPNIVQFVQALWGCGIVMERMNMTLRQRLRAPIDEFALENQWMNDTASGISFLHSHGIFHGDIGCQNILIDDDERAKLCDFAGSRLDDKDAWTNYHIRNQHPSYHQKQPDITTELFALGSVIFEIATRHQPYENISDSIVMEKFSEGEYPLHEITRPEIRCIVEKCWRSTYFEISQVCGELLELS